MYVFIFAFVDEQDKLTHYQAASHCEAASLQINNLQTAQGWIAIGGTSTQKRRLAEDRQTAKQSNRRQADVDVPYLLRLPVVEEGTAMLFTLWLNLNWKDGRRLTRQVILSFCKHAIQRFRPCVSSGASVHLDTRHFRGIGHFNI
ncbi:uncharacterized protein LOC144886501 [Branchiostoma floridae x Branchiostoma japonicum]